MYGQPLFPTSSIFVGQPLQPKPPSHHCPWPNSFLVSLSLPRALSFHLCLSPSISLSLHDISTVHSWSPSSDWPTAVLAAQWRLGGDNKEDDSLLATGRLILATVELCRNSHGSNKKMAVSGHRGWCPKPSTSSFHSHDHGGGLHSWRNGWI